ncbi:hypothetical protein KPA97_64315 [Burkholderia cenocepacia]|nr:hypothetical protein [Burkholderia cenocepacia]MDR5670734.1 hypothetical protein [Burkholderia cenocepacia]
MLLPLQRARRADPAANADRGARRQAHARGGRGRRGPVRIGVGVLAAAHGAEMVEQESVLRGIAQRRAGRQQRGAVGVVEVEAERDTRGKVVARERDGVG